MQGRTLNIGEREKECSTDIVSGDGEDVHAYIPSIVGLKTYRHFSKVFGY